jgi:hypothetical protein
VSIATSLSAGLDSDTTAALRRLASLERPPGSLGERAAAELVAAELSTRGARVRIEPERVHGTYWVPIGLASGVAALASCRRGLLPAAVGILGALSLADDLNIGRRPLRRLLRQRVPTTSSRSSSRDSGANARSLCTRTTTPRAPGSSFIRAQPSS